MSPDDRKDAGAPRREVQPASSRTGLVFAAILFIPLLVALAYYFYQRATGGSGL